jgi:hypothetical protein
VCTEVGSEVMSFFYNLSDWGHTEGNYLWLIFLPTGCNSNLN